MTLDLTNDPSNPTPLLSIRGLTKSFRLHAVGGRVVEALEGVDLDVFEGEHVALAGRSGAGKSSIIKCVNRTYLPETGTIDYVTAAGERVDLAAMSDSDVANLREHEIGYVSQFLRAAPRRSALEVVAGAARRQGVEPDEADRRAADILRHVNIDESLFGTYPSLLSGGEKQRVNLAAGLVVAPRLLLLDEPVSALDPANREAVLDVIAGVTGRGATVLSIFHDLDAMHRLADRVAVIDGGKVADIGAPAEVLVA